jgi:Tfp pilus assembly protein PilO
MSSISGKYGKTAVAVWGMCLAVFVLAFFLVIKPQMTTMASLEREYKEVKSIAETARIQAQDTTKQELQKQIDQMKTQLSRFVVASKDDIQTLASMEIDMSKKMELDAFNIDPWSAGEISAFSECKYVFGQSMKVSFNGSFQQFAKFLNMLERYKSVIFIDTFSITRAQEQDKEAKNKVEMNLAVLVEKQPAAKGKQG